MSRIRADRIVNSDATGAPEFPNGAVVSGILTATSFDGAATYATTAGIATYSTTAGIATVSEGLTGSPNIIVTDITASGNVSIAGTLTYEDVTNIDSIGIITARAGIVADGFKVEEGKNDSSTSLNGGVNINLNDGHVHRFSAATAGNYYPNFRIDSSTTLSSKMDVGDVTAVTMIVASSTHYISSPGSIQVDGSTSNIDVDWVGGSAPSAANGSGFDIYAFTIIKTAATPAYHIIANTLAAA